MGFDEVGTVVRYLFRAVSVMIPKSPRNLHHGRAGDKPMVDVQELRTTATRLRGWARQFRHDASIKNNPTAGFDAGLLDQAADQLERSAAEIDRLRELISG